MLAWFIVVALLVVALGLTGRASVVESTALRRARTLLAVAMVATTVVYAVYRDSFWMAALSILVAIPVWTMHTHWIATEALATELRAYLRDGRALLTVAQHGTLGIFRARRDPRVSASKGYRLLGGCPHCFIEWQVSALFDDMAAQRLIEHYRAKLADNRPVELQFTRSSAPPAEALVVDTPGDPGCSTTTTTRRTGPGGWPSL